MNILNAVHALGFGGIWITGPNSYDPRVAAELGFDTPDRLVGFLFVGTPGRYRPTPSRPDLADHIIEWIGDRAILLPTSSTVQG
jgi:nitroreductase